ncbi:sigma-70 family RNA polymerase sigma factor [Gottfriedia acidiceleris]|uniref:sigma-70 family RNA polymerase sigma factor n=1 Tax=Bacillaceae TaxID=186817 RepID=UPI000BED68F4|nr:MULTISPECIES: sigma-70 family RNA polymerase sigma factor [unclassified Bacillus (in: firmicutes)]PEC47258.1 RNA polymerase subunit sigma [Bacillus sp. AFS096315]PFM80632.1 RNA polymerase subunit sigma [Bacillus sp. AFS077874]
MYSKRSLHSIEKGNQDEKSDEFYWKEYYPKLQRYCHFLAQNEWDGDDIAQEAFFKAVKYYNNEKMNSALLNRIAYNHWIDTLRKRKDELIIPDVELSQCATDHPLDNKINSVELLLKHFTPKQAIIFFLKEAFQYKSKEIADILGTTEIAIKSSLHRAKKRLDKTNKDDESLSVEYFWNEEEREKLEEVFHMALEVQDPTVLIQAIPSLNRIVEIPKMLIPNFQSARTQSPSSTLCMAA